MKLRTKIFEYKEQPQLQEIEHFVNCIFCKEKWFFDEDVFEPVFIDKLGNIPKMVKVELPDIPIDIRLLDGNLEPFSNKTVGTSWTMLHFCNCGSLFFAVNFKFSGKDNYPFNAVELKPELNDKGNIKQLFPNAF